MGIRLKSVVSALALCALIDVSYAADPIKIGVDGPFTGGSSSMGVSMRDGVRLATAEINKAGGVLGRQIVLVERDDEAKNERGVQIAQELINKEKVAAVVGYINTGVALASQRFFQEAKIPVFNNVATGSVLTKQFTDQPDNYVFRNAAADRIQAPMIVEEAITKRGFRKVAILADSTNYGQLGREDLEKALATKGVKPVAVEKFNIKDVDMTAQLLKAKEAGAEAVLTYGIGPELAQIANGMAKLGWKVPLIGSWTLSMANYIDNASTNGEGARMPQTFIQEANTPKRKALHRRVPQGVQAEEQPHRIGGVRRPRLRLGLFAGRGDDPGRFDRWFEGARRARKPQQQGGRRRDGVRQAVHARRPRGDQPERAGGWRGQGRPRDLCV
ncbi:branched-chain amino acid transport system substrate-binding protein [Paraburkholderia youngii]